MSRTKGIDVSHWQGSVDFEKVRADGCRFVILNAGYGKFDSQKDERFEENYKKAKAAGLGVGAYWYSYALTEADALAEAKCFCKALSGKQLDYPVAFDIEDRTQSSLPAETIGKIITAFCSYLEKQGYYVSLYSYVSFLENKVPAAVRSKYDIWVANFDVTKPSYTGPYGMWQYTSSAFVSGVTGKCDCDYAYKDYPALIKNAGLNGYTKPSPKPALKVLDTKGLKQGDKNLGVYELKSMLSLAEKKGLISVHITVDDGFGIATRGVVDSMLTRWGYKPNGIAGQGFVERLTDDLKKKI